MEKKDVLIFTGSETTALLLKDRLEEIGISAILKNEFQSELVSNFTKLLKSSTDIYIKIGDVEKAQELIESIK